MLIRKATNKDARRISYLIRKNTDKVLENGYSEKQITIWKKANSPGSIQQNLKKRIIFCAFQNNKLVGTIGLQGNEIVGLYVSYSIRKKGIGSRLLQHLENYARKKNIKELVLTSTPSAKKFYSSKGYKSKKAVVVKVMNVDFRETAMRKRLI